MLGLVTTIAAFAAESFTVVVYNVENLHDADGVAVYDDYQPEVYTPRHVATKVENIAQLLKKFRQGAGPDVVMLQEIEIDQTPDDTVDDLASFLAEYRAVGFGDMLEEVANGHHKSVPAEAWLLKALADHGVTGYHVAVGSDAPAPPGSDGGRAIKNVTLSKYPLVAVREFPIQSARNILEVEIHPQGHPLYLFNNHWKSGASDASLEKVRIQNAEVLRDRLDELLAADPQADIIIGGDFNAYYNQKAVHPDMPRTSVNDILQAGGSETALQSGDAQFYNLWFELPSEARGSDVYRGAWGTLMHLVVSRGLYDWSGVQYQDNSFRTARIIGFNADAAGVPWRWDAGGPKGAGFSDHLPIYAHFRTVDANRADLPMPLDNPTDEEPPADVWRVNYAEVDLNQAVDLESLPPATDLKDGSWNGRLFKVSGASSVTGRSTLKVRVVGTMFDIYAPQGEVKDALQAQHVRNRRVDFYGTLGTYKGNWQFVVQDISWVQ